MRRTITFGTALTAIAGMVMAVAACNADTIFVPRGIEVPLVFDQAVSSRHAKVGDTVQLHVAHNVAVDGQTVIKRGAHVTGLITGVKHRNVFGVNGHLRMVFEPVRSAFGKTIDLEPKIAGKSSGSRPDHAAEISGGAALVLGPVGLVGGVFVVGKNVTVKPGDTIISGVNHDTYLRR